MNSNTRILVIDDDRTFTQMLSAMLITAGYETMIVPDGVTGLEVLAWFQPQLIFLDIYMPTHSGWEFLEQYRAISPNHVPVIASSAGCIEYGSLGEDVTFLAKPFELQDLLQTVESILAAN